MLYVSSDSVIGLSYYAIPLALATLVRKRRDLAFNWIFVMFAAFIFACGTTHLLGVWTLWQPVYWLDGGVKAITAGLSVATTVALWPLLPKILALPSHSQLQTMNRELEQQIAERETAAAKAEQSEKMFREFVESSPDGKVIVDEAGQILLVNAQTEKVFGYARGELLGKPVEMLLPRRFVRQHESHRAGFVQSPRVRPMGAGSELYGVRKDGTEFPVEISLSPITTVDGNLVIAAIRDMTDRKMLEKQLHEKERLATLGTTAAVFAHEIGNPLNGISSSLQLMQSIVMNAPAADRDLLDMIQMSSLEVNRLTALLNEYRSFARPQQLRLEPTDLEVLVRELLASHVHRYNAADIKIELDFERELPPVMLDAIKMKQAILNLCQNAVEAMPGGGTLSVSAHPENGYVAIEIADTGTGIAEGVDVFQLFNTTKPEGTGLGLPIVQQIVSEHSGSVNYNSRPGQGTTFRIILPATG